ncbi:pentapeptide repeat-containing protein [Rhodopila sp.]|jgi:uncharacterized protein YjbI with pentapeptide repeats|uniref:pentapeptide repeat-containing protein n=1 Tax=Rhodopila sp. TaxID=2480087 RepID=UPI002C369C69|nr:pentapeptide repeat-containing protein [Rhodopila sp.]HVZ07077.1 pentapeptide repeat-containing protein [Rhodopila sp.]
MRQGLAGCSTDFSVPGYIESLIAAINDSAKAAQRGAFLFLLVGIYLIATGFSASDEDLLLSRTLTITQLGASLPVSFSFAIAPGVFVGLHIYALASYDMLAANLRHFNAELRSWIPSAPDRERCRHLLANIEFIQALTAPGRPPARDRLWPWMFRAIAWLPVAVLLIVQINSLRYQSDLITNVQRAWLALDLLALAVFFRRVRLDGQPWPARLAPRLRRWGAVLAVPATVAAADLAYLNVVPGDADPAMVRHDPRSEPWYGPFISGGAWRQPLDLVLCPRLNWGCRYLNVAHRTLVDRVWHNEAMVALRTPDQDSAEALASVEGVVLRGRSLRFAVLDESRLYAADLIGADLRYASLRAVALQSAQMANVRLRGADLSGAQLDGVVLTGASIQGATLTGAHLRRAGLREARLQAADLSNAVLQAADLSNAQLQGADLLEAHLEGANLDGAQLQGTSLARTRMQGSLLAFAMLQGADLSDAQLQGTYLVGAWMQGANLSNVQLQGADARGLRLWRASGRVSVGLADLRRIDARTPLTDADRAGLRDALMSIPGDADRVRPALSLLGATEGAEDLVLIAAPGQPVLVSDPRDSLLAAVAPRDLVAAPDPAFVETLTGFLVHDLARSDPAIVGGLVRRAAHALSQDAADPLAVALACRLPAGAVRAAILNEPRLNLFYSTSQALAALNRCAD